LSEIEAVTRSGAAIIHMILNNLDNKVAQFPEELVTYGGNGQVFSNWAQVRTLFKASNAGSVFIECIRVCQGLNSVGCTENTPMPHCHQSRI
jgi:hypothetical protein